MHRLTAVPLYQSSEYLRRPSVAQTVCGRGFAEERETFCGYPISILLLALQPCGISGHGPHNGRMCSRMCPVVRRTAPAPLAPARSPAWPSCATHEPRWRGYQSHAAVRTRPVFVTLAEPLPRRPPPPFSRAAACTAQRRAATVGLPPSGRVLDAASASLPALRAREQAGNCRPCAPHPASRPASPGACQLMLASNASSATPPLPRCIATIAPHELVGFQGP